MPSPSSSKGTMIYRLLAYYYNYFINVYIIIIIITVIIIFIINSAEYHGLQERRN